MSADGRELSKRMRWDDINIVDLHGLMSVQVVPERCGGGVLQSQRVAVR